MAEAALIWAAVSSKPQDKYSVEDQLKLARDYCARHHIAVIDELVVRGFSRDYWTLADVVAAAAHDPDMQAFARLQDHIRRRSFTLFVCFDADRFGRTASLVHEVIGRITRDCGARIYTLFDATTMDADNAAMIGTLKAFKAQTDIDRIREYGKTGATNRAQSGKSAYGRTPLFHKILRDESGKEVAVIVNEDRRALWTDLAHVLLRGTPFTELERVLFEEFGHGKNGAPFVRQYLRKCLFHPAFWGHAATNRVRQNGRSHERAGAWVFDPAVEPPEGTRIYYNKFPAVYSGEWAELGEQVKRELYRRLSLQGKSIPQNTLRFSGLVLCDSCGSALSTVSNGRGHLYLRCYVATRTRIVFNRSCTDKSYLRYIDVQAWFDARLRVKLDNSADDLFADAENADLLIRQIDDLHRRIEQLTNRAGALVVELADAPETMRAIYRTQISAAADEIDAAQARIAGLQSKLAATAGASAAQAQFVTHLREHGLDWFWSQPDTYINQQLAAILGNNRLVARGGQVIGVIPVTRQTLSRLTWRNRRG